MTVTVGWEKPLLLLQQRKMGKRGNQRSILAHPGWLLV